MGEMKRNVSVVCLIVAIRSSGPPASQYCATTTYKDFIRRRMLLSAHKDFLCRYSGAAHSL